MTVRYQIPTAQKLADLLTAHRAVPPEEARADLATLAQQRLEAEERTAQALQQRDEAREVTAVYAANSIDYSARLAVLAAELERTHAGAERLVGTLETLIAFNGFFFAGDDKEREVIAMSVVRQVCNTAIATHRDSARRSQ
jgi:hypothetical protein